MKEEGRGFSPCENQAAVAGPLEVIRARGRRFFLSSTGGATARTNVAAAAEAAFITVFVAFTAAFTAVFAEALVVAAGCVPACPLEEAAGLATRVGVVVAALRVAVFRAGAATGFFPAIGFAALPEPAGFFPAAFPLAGAGFLTATLLAGTDFLTGREPGFAASFFAEALGAGLEAGLDFCFGRAAVLGLAPFRELAAAFLACTLAINLPRRFPG